MTFAAVISNLPVDYQFTNIYIDTCSNAFSLVTYNAFTEERQLVDTDTPPYAHAHFDCGETELPTIDAYAIVCLSFRSREIMLRVALTHQWSQTRVVLALQDQLPFVETLDVGAQTFGLIFQDVVRVYPFQFVIG